MAEPAYAIQDTGKSERFKRIREELLSAPVHLCPERALLITEYFKRYDNSKEPMVIRKAKALQHLLRNKSVKIFPDELIVGNVGSHRRSCLMQPEMAGVFLSEELLWINKRKTAPLQMPWRDRLRLALQVIPYWLTRNMIVRGFYPRFGKLLAYTAGQLAAKFYLVNEANGIGHLVPNYERILKGGVKGYLNAIEGKDGDIHKAMRTACEGLVDFSERMATEAERLAGETNPARTAELMEVARICRKVPFHPAETFHEALQSLWVTHLAVNLEGLNSAVSFGRLDQYLYPFYLNDLQKGRITPQSAKELLLCFSAKCDEHFYLLSGKISEYHGGLLMVQTITLGGVDRDGNDAVNDLTYLFLDALEEARLKEPNYMVRVHSDSPERYLHRVMDVARQGTGMPALFGDEASINSLVHHGYEVEEARDYAIVGCVELSVPRKSFLSTDAAVFSLPMCLEMALNGGKRLNGRRCVGAATPDPLSFNSLDQVIDAFRMQVEYMAERMINDLKSIEDANREYHPTPLTSMLVDGCIESGLDVTAGGAIYNSSGVQGVGVADVADSLAALDSVVFREQKYTMGQVLEALRTDFASHPKLHAELLKAPKFGNGYDMPDEYADMAVHVFHAAVTRHTNTRGGPYVPGFYSDTSYAPFGRYAGALPSGRKAGEPFAASLSACNGRDKLGPTALLNSVAHVDSKLAPNGYAVNLRFDPQTLAGDRGPKVLAALAKGFFSQGGMEMQLNVVDHEILGDARRNPGKYPGLMVRVAGYCAYFDDLPDSVKREIITRTRLSC